MYAFGFKQFQALLMCGENGKVELQGRKRFKTGRCCN
jgi:hypothetical protein